MYEIFTLLCYYRKPKVTRKVVESEEEDAVIGGIGFEGIDDLLNSMGDEVLQFEEEMKKDEESDSNKPASHVPSKKKEDAVDVDEEGNFILPEGMRLMS